MTDFAGRWFTTFGPMTLTRSGTKVTGTYVQNGATCQISGRIKGGALEFTYEEAKERGEGTFRLVRHGCFVGEYMAEGAESPAPWSGHRGFDGIWDTSFGRMRIVEEEDRVLGFYEVGGGATIEGRSENGRLAMRYKEPKTGGEGWFMLDPSGTAFAGEWRPDGEKQWGEWSGRRVAAQRGLVWLVVLEAHWQRTLADNEYAFGHMLREVFARLPNVRVRQRFFQDETSLLHWCRELVYLAEPAILVITSHGEPEGVSVHGRVIDTPKVVEALRYADTLGLLHFSCCLIAQDAKGALVKAPFPVSGYTTSVDWGQSAMLEFIYLDMILGKGLAPAEAAEQLVSLVRFAADKAPKSSPYAPAGFRFFEPSSRRGGGSGA